MKGKDTVHTLGGVQEGGNSVLSSSGITPTEVRRCPGCQGRTGGAMVGDIGCRQCFGYS